jgi:hypothetical protein
MQREGRNKICCYTYDKLLKYSEETERMLKEQYPNLYEKYEQKGQLNDQRAAFFYLCKQIEKDNKRTLK